MNEGFFADVVVLVEGEDDRAAVVGMAAALGYDLESHGGNGVAVIPCMGKANLDRPMLIFQMLGIPTYIVWDSDKGKDGARPEINRCLLRLAEQAEEDWPAMVAGRFACFECDLETTLKTEIGLGLFDQILQEAQSSWDIARREQALKNPVVVQKIIQDAMANGQSIRTLEAIIQNILALIPEVSTP
jgi:predicted ATP-dependent endonuclease of OLD family